MTQARRPDDMAVTGINSEDRLVQATFAEHLREQARLGERLCLERRDLRAGRHARARQTRREAVLTRDLRAALVRLNPDLPPAAIDDALRALTVHDFSRSMVQHNQDFYRLIRNGVPVSYRDAAGHLRDARARVIDFDNRPGIEPLPRRARAEAHRPAHAELQPPRRSRLLRQRPAAGLHRAEGRLQEHPRRLRRQPARLHGRERHRARLPPQRLPDRQQRRPRPLRLDHQRVGAFRRMEAPRRDRQGQASMPRCCSTACWRTTGCSTSSRTSSCSTRASRAPRARWWRATIRCSASTARWRRSSGRRS